MENLKFIGKRICDFCGNEEICANTHYGTSNYIRTICLECAMSVNEHDKAINNEIAFDLNNSIIRFIDSDDKIVN